MPSPKYILFVFGCQRSGTTALIKSFKSHENIRVFNEVGEIIHRNSDDKFRIRLKPLNKLDQIFSSIDEDVIVLKPLVESSKAINYLNYFPNSYGIWAIRQFEDVVFSMLKKWGPNVGSSLLKAIKKEERENWRSATTARFFEYLKQTNISKLSPESSGALFWYIRNTFYLEQELYKAPNLKLLEYDKLVSHDMYFKSVLDEIDFPINLDSFEFKRKTLSNTLNNVSPTIRLLCVDLYFNIINKPNKYNDVED